MQCNMGYNKYQCGVVNIVNVAIGNHPLLVEVQINGKDAQALADSGNAVTLVSPTCGLKTGITWVHGDINFYPTTKIRIEFHEEMF